MDLINMKQKEAVREWAKRNYDEKIFHRDMNFGEESYYQRRTNEDQREIHEYDIADIEDILSMFNDEWKDRYDDEIKKIVAVSILVGKNRMNHTHADAQKKKSDKIPEFIYAF